MRFRPYPIVKRWLLAAVLLACSLAVPVLQAAEVDILQAQLEKADDGYRLNASYSFTLHRPLEDALNRGVPLYFTTDVELTRPRWYWFDENTLHAHRTVRLSYNVLTRQYHAAVSGGLWQSFPSLDEALALIQRPGRWVVAEPGALKPGATYNVAVRMHLDITQLPKPFQVNALNDSDWRLSSDWKVFRFKAD